MAKHRTHSVEFKRQVVQEFLGGESPHALAKRHGISRNLIKIWVAKYEAGGLDSDTAAADVLADYEARIAALERLVGKLALENEFLKGASRHVRQLRTDSSHDGSIFPTLPKHIVPTNLTQLWVADITYIAITTGFVYLAATLDAWSRRVVGYAIGRRIDARLALAALRAAIAARRPPAGCIHHSDRGSQYAAEDYHAELAKHGLTVRSVDA